MVLLSPYVPLLFMGEEYGETAPFQYFTSHGDPALIDAVRKGRREEFATFRWHGEAPDPQAEDTFRRSRLQLELRRDGRHRVLFDWHRELLRLRKTVPSLARLSKECLQVREFESEKTLLVRRWCDGDDVWMVFNLGERAARLEIPTPVGTWRTLLDSSDPRWLGHGPRRAESICSDGVVELTIESRGMALYRREAAN
jgi:maltooligosyltrehalose trehalohydrolase